jgi:ATP adenylyltransferase
VAADCPICLKHRGEGPLRGELIGRTDHMWVYHAPPDGEGLASLGHLFIESDRHAPHVADLTPDESAELGRLRTRLASAIREATDAEFVLAAVIGIGVDHFHEHLFIRPRGTPAEVPWHESDEAAPRVDPEGVRRLRDQLRPCLESEPPT